MTQAHVHAHGGEEGHGEHPPYLAHHFDTPKQQFESGKLGMWLFLATELLMFGGLFCAYSVFRANHPEIFLYAHHYLDTTWGAINTVVLLVSSFTMAWGVRAAQLGQQRLLIGLLVATFLGACGFMVIKGIEYNAKFSHDLGPGLANLFSPASAEARAQHLGHLEHEYGLGSHGGSASQSHGSEGEATLQEGSSVGQAVHEMGESTNVNPHTTSPQPAAIPAEHSLIAPAAAAPAGIKPDILAAGRLPAVSHGVYSYHDLSPRDQARVHGFFQVYFLMTGLHGIHVVIGMGLITYITIRAIKGHFGPEYFTPVDVIGLYWHLVDLIWIFLFPLLYLIH